MEPFRPVPRPIVCETPFTRRPQVCCPAFGQLSPRPSAGQVADLNGQGERAGRGLSRRGRDCVGDPRQHLRGGELGAGTAALFCPSLAVAVGGWLTAARAHRITVTLRDWHALSNWCAFAHRHTLAHRHTVTHRHTLAHRHTVTHRHTVAHRDWHALSNWHTLPGRLRVPLTERPALP